MSGATPVAVVGVAGRMGQMLVAAVDEAPEAELVGVTERPGHPWVGRDLGEALGGPPRGLAVEDEALEVFARARAVLDFTAPVATLAHAALAAQARLVHVIGTTGLSADDLHRLEAAARHAVIVRAGNMSLGINLLTELTRRVSAALGETFDIEIVEMHHRHKVDAPSGTALMLGEAAAAGRGRALAELAERARDGMTGARRPGAVGMAAHGGGVGVGEHDVVFAGPGERIILRHVASDRMIFARGAVRAALWGQAQKPGAYSMLDVLGI